MNTITHALSEIAAAIEPTHLIYAVISFIVLSVLATCTFAATREGAPYRIVLIPYSVILLAALITIWIITAGTLNPAHLVWSN